MKLGTALGDSFKTYFKKPLLFSGIYAAAMLLLIVFNLILLPSGALVALPLALMTGDVAAIFSIAGLLFLLYLAVAIITGALSLGGMIKASSEVVGGHKTTIIDCLKFAFGLIKDYIILGLRVFWYSLAWVLILVMILLPLISGMFGAKANAQAPGDMPAEYAQMMEDLSQLEGMDNSEALQALRNMDFNSMASYGTYDFTPGLMANPLFAIIFLVLLVIVIYRSLQVVFSFYIFYDDPKMGTKAALEKSIKIMKGNIWRLIGYLIVFGLIIGVASGIITSVLLDPIAKALSSGFQGFIMWQMILGFVLAAVVAPITILFYYVTYKGWSKEHGH
jgi:hypothetical protein